MNQAEWVALTKTSAWRDVTAHMHRNFERFVEGIRQRAEMQKRASSTPDMEDQGERGSIREMAAIINQTLIYAGMQMGFTPPCVTAVLAQSGTEVFSNLALGKNPEDLPGYSIWWVLRAALLATEAQLLSQTGTDPRRKMWSPAGILFRVRAWRLRRAHRTASALARAIGKLPARPGIFAPDVGVQKCQLDAKALPVQWRRDPDLPLCADLVKRMGQEKTLVVPDDEVAAGGLRIAVLFDAVKVRRDHYAILYGAWVPGREGTADGLRAYSATMFVGRRYNAEVRRVERKTKTAPKKSAIDALSERVK